MLGGRVLFFKYSCTDKTSTRDARVRRRARKAGWFVVSTCTSNHMSCMVCCPGVLTTSIVSPCRETWKLASPSQPRTGAWQVSSDVATARLRHKPDPASYRGTPLRATTYIPTPIHLLQLTTHLLPATHSSSPQPELQRANRPSRTQSTTTRSPGEPRRQRAQRWRWIPSTPTRSRA